MHDNFLHKAKDWDALPLRVQNTLSISHAILNEFKLNDSMEIMDFGVGTGLLGFEIARHVKKVYGVDTSKSMLEQLEAKNTPELSITPLCQDIVAKPLSQKFDGVISSMTLHHIEHLDQFFKVLHRHLKDESFIAIADLEREDGTFHSDNTGVFHFGFDTDELIKIVEEAGFWHVKVQTTHTISKPHGDFPIFLLSARKR